MSGDTICSHFRVFDMSKTENEFRDDFIKRAALHFLRTGQMTVGEVAERAGVSRMTVWRWMKWDKINIYLARDRKLQKLWRKRLELRR
jgi:DNA invertase Pin-like site-specific DNA recombinase